MAKKEHLKEQRVYSEAFKRRYVKLIEEGKESVITVSRTHGVSRAAVYKWINRYSGYLQSGQTLVVQMDSEESKVRLLEKQLAEAQSALGRKQMEIDFLNKMIEVGKRDFKFDLKKKVGTQLLSGSGSTGDNTPTK